MPGSNISRSGSAHVISASRLFLEYATDGAQGLQIKGQRVPAAFVRWLVRMLPA
jgi:hypothetical protein